MISRAVMAKNSKYVKNTKLNKSTRFKLLMPKIKILKIKVFENF